MNHLPKIKQVASAVTAVVGRIVENQSSTEKSQNHNEGGFSFASKKASDILDGIRPPHNTPNKKTQGRNPTGLKKIVLAERFHDMAGSVQNAFNSGQKSYYSPPRDIADSVTPYIGLRARLSQVWLNEYTVFLILVIIKIALFRSSLTSSLTTAEKYTLNSCKSAENLSSSAASAPHYLAIGANSLISKGITITRQGLIEMLIMSLTVIEQLVLFLISMMVGTYTCLLTVAVDTAANTAINATEAIISYVDDALDTVVTGIEDGVDALQTAINSVSSAFNSIASAFSDDNSASLISNVSLSVSSLKNISIPTSINSKLEELRGDIPTYADVKNATGEVVSIPFNLLKKEINETFLTGASPFNVSAIHIPAKQQISFCSDGSGISDFYDTLQEGVALLSKIFIIVLALIAVIMIVPVAYREIKEWRWIRQCADDVQDMYDTTSDEKQPSMILNPTSNQRLDNIELIQTASHKWVTRLQLLAAKRFSNLTHKTLAKWWVDYVLYPPALMVLSLGLCGILIVCIQFIIFSQVKNALPDLAKGIEHVAESALADVQTEVYEWANSTNIQIQNTQDDINDNLLGWVHTATGSINDTLSVFMTTMNKDLNETFGDTPFYDGITGVVYSVIGSKIESVQKGIAWIHNNSQIALPTVSYDYILPSTSDSDTNVETTNSTISGLADSAVDLMKSSMLSVIEVYEKSLFLELKISAVLLSLWFLVALIGFLYCWYVSRRISKNVPPARHFTSHERVDSLESDYYIDKKFSNAHMFPGGAPESSQGFKSSYQHYKSKIIATLGGSSGIHISPPILPEPVKLKDLKVHNGSSNRTTGDNYGLDTGDNRRDMLRPTFHSNNGNDASLVFRPPSALACETPMTPTAPGRHRKRQDSDEDDVQTPLTPVPVNNSPGQKPMLGRSPVRQSVHAVRGFLSGEPK